MQKQIFYGAVTVSLHKRGKTWNNPETVKEVVFSGTVQEMNEDPAGIVKKRALAKLFELNSNPKKKVNDFELHRIRILKVEISHVLGLGFLGQQPTEEMIQQKLKSINNYKPSASSKIN